MARTLLLINSTALTDGPVQQLQFDTPTTTRYAQNPEAIQELRQSKEPMVAILEIGSTTQPLTKLIGPLVQANPRCPLIVVSIPASSDQIISAMQAGTHEYLTTPIEPTKLQFAIEGAFAIQEATLNGHGQTSPAAASQEGMFVGTSPPMQEIFKQLGRLAGQNINTLILGETGTGKELVARAIQQYSQRQHKPYLALNCAAIPDTLLESELFGHERGAFTGAEQRRIGKFEKCDHGTIFLDEVGDMAPGTQTKMLRLLQEGTFERVGGTETVKVDVRVLAATNQDLLQLVDGKRFRRDLYYRLNTTTIQLPALRQHAEDIPQLAEHFLQTFARQLNKPVRSISPEAMIQLQAYQWPGNVRELQNILHTALIRSSGTVLLSEFLPEEIAHSLAPPAHDQSDQETTSLDDLFAWLLTECQTDMYDQFIAQVRPILITRVLRAEHGNLARASERLGLSRVTLRTYMRKDNLKVSRNVEHSNNGS